MEAKTKEGWKEGWTVVQENASIIRYKDIQSNKLTK